MINKKQSYVVISKKFCDLCARDKSLHFQAIYAQKMEQFVQNFRQDLPVCTCCVYAMDQKISQIDFVNIFH